MASIRAGEQEVAASLEGFEDRLTVAALNSPTSVTVSGEEDALIEWEAAQEEQGRKVKRLEVSHAFHSHRMEPMLEEFEQLASTLQLNPPRIPIVSNVSGEELNPEQATSPAYWAAQIRQPVRFAAGIEQLKESGASRFLELGAGTTLTALAQETLDGEELTFSPSLRKELAEPTSFVTALGAMRSSGAEVDLDSLVADAKPALVDLPTYPFQRQRYWLEPSLGSGDAATLGQATTDHPLLGARISLAQEGSHLFTGRICQSTHAWTKDHAVVGAVLLPGTAFLELALRAGAELGAERIEELVLEAPLVLPQQGAIQLQLSLAAEEDGERYALEVHSRPESCEEDEGEEVAWTRHASGTLAPGTEASATSFDAAAWPPSDAEPLPVEDFYDRATELGLEYGPAFQGLEAAWSRGEEIFAEVSLAEEQRPEAERFGVHPALLDAALHASLIEDSSSGTRLPFSFGDVLAGPATGAWRLRVRMAEEGERARLDAVDPDGGTVVSIGALATRPLDPSQLRVAGPRRDSLFSVAWEEVELGEGAGELELHECRPDPELDPATAAQALSAAVLSKLQSFLAEGRGGRLALLTEGATAVAEGEALEPAAAAVWGLVRSAQSEHPGRFVLVDSDGSEASRQALRRVPLVEDAPQIALRDGVPFAPRMVPADAGLRPPERPWRLEVGEEGTLEGLRLVEAPEAERRLESHEVRVAIRVAGLNFRDVLVALGMYPEPSGVGGDGAGVVVEVGSEVEGFAPGDRVFGLVPHAFGPLAVADARMLAPLPASWSFAQGAAVPIASATAYRALVDLGALRPGERVLIHAGAGGVGMAAIQIAHDLGAEVFATASPAKWGALRELGLDEDHIASSRDLSFREKFLAATDGEGMNVVLDSLAREFVDASLDLLPRGGRFLEMGKTDVRDAAAVADSHPGVEYQAFDLSEAGPGRIGEILSSLVELFEAGALEHSPIRSWDVRRAPDAFRFLSQARHTGKVVLTLPRALDPDGTVLLTGGLTGLGALTARHLTEAHGARHLLLVGRRGPDTPGAAELIAELAELGCEATALACDVADRAQLEALLAEVPPERPLTGVFHCAGVLDDGTIEALDRDRLDAVLRPKVEAAWHLHELTAELDLAAFVLYSSIAGVFGAPGQANYAAANSFLDALAAERRSQALPASAIAWGLWEADDGMGSRLSAKDRDRHARGGIAPFAASWGLEQLDRARALPCPACVAASFEWSVLRAAAREGTLPPILSRVVAANRRRPEGAAGSLARRLATVPGAEREAVVLAVVREHAAAVLGHGSGEAIDPQANFKDLGFDSLGAVELRNRISRATGASLDATLAFDHPTPGELTAHLLERFSGAGTARSAIDEEFDRLEGLLHGLDREERQPVAARLRSLTARFQQVGWEAAQDGAGEAGDVAGADLDRASDEELFELIDQGLARRD